MKTYEAVRRLSYKGGLEALLAISRNSKGAAGGFVVLERLLPQYSASIGAWLAEGRQAATLRHDNIQGVQEVVENGNESAIVLDYLSGEDLSFILEETTRTSQRIPTQLACEIVLRAAKALQYAHTRKRPILHHEIAPNNITIGYDGQVKVQDFGTAKALGDRSSDPLYVKNTLPFLAPEQFTGAPISAQTDLFALGVLFHEMLTSKRLFGGPSSGAVIRNIQERYVPPPSVYNPEVTVKLDEIVLGLLQRSPTERVLSAAALVSNLERYQKEQSGPNDRAALANWMCSAFGPRRQERSNLEREILHAVQNGQRWSGTDISDAFASTSQNSTGFESRSYSGNVSQSVSAVAMMSTQAPGGHPTPSVRSSKGPKLLGAALVLIAIALLAVIFLPKDQATVASTTDSQTSPATQSASTTASASQTTKPTPTETNQKPAIVGLELHVLPVGAVANIKGSKKFVTVNKSGALLPAPAESEVTIQINKPDFETKELVINTPDSGQIPVYVNLDPIETTPVVAKTETEAETETTGRTRSGKSRATQRQRAKALARISAERERAKAAAERERTRKYGTLSVTYRPSNASVVIDGISRSGSSPLKVSLPPGPHSVRVSAPGFVSENTRIQLKSRDNESVDIRLKADVPDYAEIEVVSSPSGARIKVNGSVKGSTPESIRVARDKLISVEVTKEGYETWRDSIMPSTSKVVRVRANLKRIPESKPTPKAPEPKPIKVQESDVQKIAGSLPTIRSSNVGSTQKTKPIPITMCINSSGKVVGANMQVSGALKKMLLSSLGKWRYKPYQKNGVAVPVCFVKSVQLSIVEK